MTVPYLPPVDRLLKLGAEPARRRTWPDYRNLGLEPRHVPALIRMATDPALHAAEERDPAGWAPVHAWRSLAQLEADAAAEPLLALLEREIEHPWVVEEVPAVLGMIGGAALHGATLLLFDEERNEEVRLAAAAVIANVAHEHPERRDEAAAILVKQLEDWDHQSRLINAYLVADLVGLGEKDAAPLMEAAFAAHAVDLTVGGDWEDMQIELGLLSERTTPPPPETVMALHREGSVRPPTNAEAKAKARRKAEKEARKRNRKKK
ncbi:MAG TPA: hypothetical protein VLK84_07870 [Longimicrobium sp.]|nr:hypothetical protein [Longimicrobium sp.]